MPPLVVRGADASTSAPRRIVVSYASDMKGLMQILGHAGPNVTYPCLLCYARLNQTFVKGVPHIPVLPEPWASDDKREADIINPPRRIGTKDMAEYAQKYSDGGGGSCCWRFN